MNESRLLEHIYRRSAGLSEEAGVLVGPGDDAAVVRIGPEEMLVAADQLIGGRHFDADNTPTDLIARKAIARNVSDIAAMAGTPLYTLCTASLPHRYPHADELFDRCHEWAGRFGCPLVGGDIARADGPLVLSVTIIGRPHAERGAVLRSGARVGDGVFLSGAVGGAFESGRHLTFEPRVSAASGVADDLGPRAHALIDLSDGLGLDAGRIARASGVRLELEAQRIPLNPGLAGWREAIASGEDYELLLCAEAEQVHGWTRVGTVVFGEGCVVHDAGEAIDVTGEGWDHG